MDETWKIRILVLEAGFVKVCRCPDPEGYAFWLPYRDARTIRRWGTTKGLGELCGGPVKETILDDLVAEGRVPVRAIIDVLETQEDKWAPSLTPATSAASTHRSARRS